MHTHPVVTAAFDSGNIEVLDAGDPAGIRLAIRPDSKAAYHQWFHFRVSCAPGTDLVLRLENAGSSSYPRGWEGYSAVVSEDRLAWRRAETAYEGGVLTIRYRATGSLVWFAAFAPYPLERHHDLVARVAAAPGVRHAVLATTADGHDLDLLTIGEGPAPVWTIARQHPGEAMAEWWMEGFLARLADPADALARALRGKATFHVVPNMNPDGTKRGHLRTNAHGVDLNRAWATPDPATAPEVFHVAARMRETGVALALDVHGEEGLPWVFLAGPDGVPSRTERQAALTSLLRTSWIAACPDLQAEHGYPSAAPGKADLRIGCNWIAETFGCPAGTLEMPFKDNSNAPDPVAGWSPARSMRLGAAALDAIAAVLAA
ncbi:MAG: M14-type cytosolic carboxypeptidase [Alphaproteobacteria bacterium]